MFDMKEILDAVASGQLKPEDAAGRIRILLRESGSFAEMGHTKLDLQRRARRGVAEAVYCAGKTPMQALEIAARLDADGQNVLCTRVSAEMAVHMLASRPDFIYNAVARIIYKRNEAMGAPRGLILVLTAGTSDIPVAEEAALSAEMMGDRVERVFDVGVAGIHRLFGAAGELMRQARVIIVAAGMEGALPSVVAGLVGVPVIATPTSAGYGASFGGVTALLAMLTSCSGGVAVVNIDNGFGAALLAHLINQPAQDNSPEQD
ncbi:MAG: nickel pincer cofactor biosynthesis protein LarB [bacterium]